MRKVIVSAVLILGMIIPCSITAGETIMPAVFIVTMCDRPIYFIAVDNDGDIYHAPIRMLDMPEHKDKAQTAIVLMQAAKSVNRIAAIRMDKLIGHTCV